MLYRLRRHPVPIAAHLRHSLVLAYALPRERLEPLVPASLQLDSEGEVGFAAAAFVQTERLRPAFLPAAVGLDFFLAGYRVFVRVAAQPSLRGLYILRSDADRRLIVVLGNALTRYRYRGVDASCRVANGSLEIQVRPGVDVVADLSATTAPLPEGSPFSDERQARRFAGPLPYTFHHELETGSLLAVRGSRSGWEPRPVTVSVRELSFFASGPFEDADATLANAFYVGGVDYCWERGRLLSAVKS
jgi:Uncharacterized conserved protein (COG2071)